MMGDVSTAELDAVLNHYRQGRAETPVDEGVSDLDRHEDAGNTASILHMALEVTRGSRNEDYGHPLDDYTRTAAMWTAYLGHEVTAEQAMGCMILVKMSRLAHTPGHMDSLVDVAGYADCMHRANVEATRRASSG